MNWERDLHVPIVADIRNVVAGDPSPCGNGTLDIKRGIEVGHIFQLGTKYSEALKARVLDENGKERYLFSGDTLFIGDVGRPDLAQKSTISMEDLAGMLYNSLETKMLPSLICCKRI